MQEKKEIDKIVIPRNILENGFIVNKRAGDVFYSMVHRIRGENLRQFDARDFSKNYITKLELYLSQIVSDLNIVILNMPLSLLEQKEYWQRKRDKSRYFEQFAECNYIIEKLSNLERNKSSEDFYQILFGDSEEELKSMNVEKLAAGLVKLESLTKEEKKIFYRHLFVPFI